MANHEPKLCERCQRRFECKSGSVLQCQCNGILLNEEAKRFIEARYTDCLCRDCLIAVQRYISPTDPTQYFSS